MPIRISIGPPGQRQTKNLTEIVAKMTGRFPVFTDDQHVKNRERYQGKRKRRI
jgi:hypothetical protein